MQTHPPASPPAIFDPWETCRRMGVDIIRTDLRDARGYTNGHDTIWVHVGLNTCEERVAVCHEIVHITQGHVGRQPPDVEDLVRRVTARWLVPWPHITQRWSDPSGFDKVADELCVTVDVVRDRLAYATCEELVMLQGASCDLLAA